MTGKWNVISLCFAISLFVAAVLFSCSEPESGSDGSQSFENKDLNNSSEVNSLHEPFLSITVDPLIKMADNTDPISMTPTVITSDSGEDVTYSSSFSWTSSDELIATVDSTGNMTPVGNGTVTITVTAEYGSYSPAQFSVSIEVSLPDSTFADGRVILFPEGADIENYTGSDGSIQSANDDETPNPFTYFNTEPIGDGNYRIIGYNSFIPEYLFIPSFISGEISKSGNDETITEIGYEAFINRSNGVEIAIEEGISIIDDKAFSDMDGLVNIFFPNKMERIGKLAFVNSDSLEKVVIAGGNELVIEERAFYQTPVKYVSIGNGLKSIEERAFCQTGLISIIIGNGLRSIGEQAFYQSTSLQSVSLPTGIEDIQSYAFSGCTGLESIILPDSLTSLGKYTFEKTGLTEIQISEGVTVIPEGLFHESLSLTSVTIPEGVVSIETNAFMECSSLNNVVLPNSLTTIGSQAFYKCSSLSDITLGNSLEIIEFIAFAESNLSGGIQFPASLTTIGGGAFVLSKITSVVFPDNAQITTIEFSAFQQCLNLSSFRFEGSAALEVLPERMFFYATALSDVSLPEGLTTIGAYAFSNTTSLQEITIPSTVYNFGGKVFDRSSVHRVTILGDGNTNPGGGIFPKASQGRIDFFWDSRGIASIGQVFANCDNLTEITIQSTIPPRASDSLFGPGGFYPPEMKIRIPAGSYDNYNNALGIGWENYLTLLEEF